MSAFKPDTIIAIGGGSAMDAAKIMWLKYERPDIELIKLPEEKSEEVSVWNTSKIVTTITL